MEKLENNKGVGFKLNMIKTEQFAILEENFNQKVKIKLNTSINFKIDADNQFVVSFVEFKFHQKMPFLKVQVSCVFAIENGAWQNFIDKDKNSITLPKGFLAHLATITVGTTRGVLFAKTEGTEFNKFFVPTINVLDIITEDSVFELNQ